MASSCTNLIESEQEIQRKMNLILSKTQNIMNSLYNYRENMTQSICYEQNDQGINSTTKKKLDFYSLFSIVIPSTNKQVIEPKYVSTSCQTEDKITIKIKTQQTQMLYPHASYFEQTRQQSNRNLDNFNINTRFASATQVKQICLSKNLNMNTQMSSRLRSKSKGISVTSRESSASTSNTKYKITLKNKQKQKQKQKQNEKKSRRIILTSGLKTLNKSLKK